MSWPGMLIIFCLTVKNISKQSISIALVTHAAQWTSICLWISVGWQPSTHVWMDSSPGMPLLTCNGMLHKLAIHPVDYIVLHKCLPIFLPSHISNCPIYTATAALWTGFTCTCLTCLQKFQLISTVSNITIFHAKEKIVCLLKKIML